MLAARVMARKAQNECTATAGPTRIDDLFDFAGMSFRTLKEERNRTCSALHARPLSSRLRVSLLKDCLFALDDSIKRNRRPRWFGDD